MLGYDFSHWNSDKQFNEKLPSAQFFFHKSSEGMYNQDPCCIARLKSTTKPCGVYHVVVPKKNAWENEFENFCAVLDRIFSFRKCGIALDLENSSSYVPYDSGEDILVWLFNMVTALKNRYGQPVILYMGDLYPDQWYRDLEDAGAVFWIARWGKTPKHKCHFWQSADNLNGEKIDVDQSMVSDEEVRRCLGDVTKYPMKTVTEEEIQAALRVIARSIWQGRFGMGKERKELIYKAVQNCVNDIGKEG